MLGSYFRNFHSFLFPRNVVGIVLAGVVFMGFTFIMASMPIPVNGEPFERVVQETDALLQLVTPNKADPNTIVITASKRRTPLRAVGASVVVIDEEEIEQKGYTSLASILETEVGISVSRTGGQGAVATLRVRGEEGYRTRFFIDGVEMSDPSGPQLGVRVEHLVDAASIERIEVLKGPQGFIYGADAGGVVNIITKTPTKLLEGQLSERFGRYHSRRVDGYLGNAWVNGSSFLSFMQQNSDGFNVRDDDDSLDKDGYDNRTYHGTFRFDVSDQLSTQLVLRNIAADNEFDHCFFAGRYIDDCLDVYVHRVAKASAYYRTQRSSKQWGLSITETERDSFANGLSSFPVEGERMQFDYLDSYQWGQSIEWSLGLDYNKDKMRQLAAGASIIEPIKQLGVFSEFQALIQEQLSVALGLRFDDNSAFGQHWSQRISGAFSQSLPRGELTYKVSAGTGFRAPSLYENYYNISPNAFGAAQLNALQEERSRGQDVGVHYYSHHGLVLGVTWFSQKIQDEIYFDLVDFSGYLQAEGFSHSKGVEIEMDYPLSINTALTSHYTYNKTRSREGMPRLLRPQQSGNIGLRFDRLHRRLKLYANVRFSRNAVDQRFGFAGQELIPLDNYKVLDVNARYQIDRHLSLFTRIDNLTNRDYQLVNGYETAARSLIAGFKMTF